MPMPLIMQRDQAFQTLRYRDITGRNSVRPATCMKRFSLSLQHPEFFSYYFKQYLPLLIHLKQTGFSVSMSGADTDHHPR